MHADYNQGPIFYMCPNLTMIQPPNFVYTMVNVVREDFWIRFLGRPVNKTFALSWNPGKSKRGACSNATSVCDARALQKYGAKTDPILKNGVMLLQHQRNGLLNVPEFKYGKQRCVIAECSDVCGCDHNWARRQLQQAKVPALVVMPIGKLGFCLYAAEKLKKGQFIIEFTGEIFLLKGETYEPGTDLNN